MNSVKSEAQLTFWEATSIIIGHGVGSGILAVPYLASRNRFSDVLLILTICYMINLVMHFMIAELSYNNAGNQLIKCFERELFRGKIEKSASWIMFALLGISVIVNISGFIVGAGDVLLSWFHYPRWIGMFLFYLIASFVVFFGMKLVGICEKISVFAMVFVMLLLFIAVMTRDQQPLMSEFIAVSNYFVLYSMVSFSLSAVMSVPQVVKGLNGHTRQIKASIAVGTGINLLLILLITVTTMLGAGTAISTRGALVDLSEVLGGWVSIIGYLFSLLALSTSFWANSLNLRDVIMEQTNFSKTKSWLLTSLPSLCIALLGVGSFVGLVRFAGVVQILTGLAVILSYHRTRARVAQSPICGWLGIWPWQIIVAVASVLATIGSLLKVL